MAVTIGVEQRDALYGLLRLRLGGINDLAIALEQRNHLDAARLGRWHAAELRLMDYPRLGRAR